MKAGRKGYETRLLDESIEDSLLESRSPVMRRLLENARQAARSNATILLTGESGTGKGVLARQIHLWSPRRRQPFATVDCKRLSHAQVGSALNAPSVEAACLEDQLAGANTGTIVLAGVDELHPAYQRGLAHFLQDRTLHALNGEKQHLDVRIIASSNRTLLSEVRAHRFSEELFYSLSIVSLNVPLLCERPMDILPLASRMLAAAAIRNHRGDLQLSAEAAAAMTIYSWPGNLRELRNAMEAAAVLCEGQTVALAALPEPVANATNGIIPASSSISLEDVERRQILRVLAESATLEQAAATLGINVSTLWRKRKRYNLDLTTGWKLKRTAP